MATVISGFQTVTTAGIAVALAAVATPVSWITIYPRIANSVPNTGQVRIGGAPVSPATGIASGSGAPLNPGDAAVAWWLGGYYDLREIYIDADNNGDGVQWVAGVN